MDQFWEYKRVSDVSDNLLNALGQAGWELVAITATRWYVFKRPLKRTVRLGS